MQTKKQAWLIELGREECQAWVNTMEQECLETVRIRTPMCIDYSSAEPYQDFESVEYTAEDFQAVLVA